MNSRLRELLRVAWESQEELTMRVKLIISPSTTCMFGKSSEVRRTFGWTAGPDFSRGKPLHFMDRRDLGRERERERDSFSLPTRSMLARSDAFPIVEFDAIQFFKGDSVILLPVYFLLGFVPQNISTRATASAEAGGGQYQ